MMQRLLRGWILYVVLGAVAVGLYVHGRPPSVRHELNALEQQFEARVGVAVPSVEAPSTFSRLREPALEWWPKELTQAAVRRRVAGHPRLFMTVTALGVIIIGLTIGGLFLSFGWMWAGGFASFWRTPAARLPRWSLAEVARIILLMLLIASLMPFVRIAMLAHLNGEGPDDHLWIAASMLFLDGFVVLTVAVFALGKGLSVWRFFSGSARHLSHSIGVGLRSYVMVFPWMFALLFLIAQVARWCGFTPPAEPIQELIFQEHRPLVLGLTVVLACAIGPLAEECFFRGVVYPAIRGRTSVRRAMLLSGGLFALVHTNWVGFLPILLLGVLLAYVYERTGSLMSSLAVHVVHNTMLIGVAMTVRSLSASS
ncbi:MAG: CPBP family intramembrane metalloprotease [Candidatus Omnitrophica bacterium]|nr:CPBP family intramembrane metalloprotease [Candidatus Omnitrophota bacterium]